MLLSSSGILGSGHFPLRPQADPKLDTRILSLKLVNKAVRGGFTFNVMCIGETGLGKSTLMDSLFNTSFESMPADHKSPDVKLKSRTYELEESSVRLNVSRSALINV